MTGIHADTSARRFDFEATRETLLDLAERAKTLLPKESAGQVDATAQRLRSGTFEVAFIGAIKAGKSTLINALIEQPKFLPAHVNPWTGTIAKLHLGAKSKEMSAVFHFFTRKEWNDMLGGKMASLTRKISGPGRQAVSEAKDVFKTFESRVLPDQQSALPSVEPHFEISEAELQIKKTELERSVKEKLGKKYRDHLGRTVQLSREELRQPGALAPYLCSGKGSSEWPDAGKYTDLVREADVYLPSNTFAYQVSIVDTPGTNDPFKARSRIADAYLSRADAFVLVMNASQALTSDDENKIIHLLRTLDKDKLVVFVNRIDSLNHIVADRHDVQQRVVKEMQRIAPDRKVPIVMGSASLMETSHGGQLDVYDYQSRKWREVFVHDGEVSEEQVERWKQDPERFEADIRAQLESISGIARLRSVIEDHVLAHKGSVLAGGARNDLQHLLEAQAAEFRRQAQQHRDLAESIRGEMSEARAKIAEAESNIKRLDAIPEKATGLTDKLRVWLEGVGRKSLDKIRGQMLIRARSMVRAQVKEKEKISVWGEETWSVDLAVLRDGLAGTFRVNFGPLLRVVNDRFAKDQRALVGIFESAGFGAVDLDVVSLSEVDPEPLLRRYLRQDSEVDLGGAWSRLWSGSETAQEKRQELLDKALESVENSVNALIEEIRVELNDAGDNNILELAHASHAAQSRAKKEINQQKKTLRELQKATTEERAQMASEQDDSAESCLAQALAIDEMVEDVRAVEVPSSRIA